MAISFLIPKGSTATAAAYLLHRIRVGKGAVNKFRIDFLWRGEQFWIIFFKGGMNSHLCPSNWFPNCLSKQEGALNFIGLSQDEGRTDFSENLRFSLFIDDLWNEQI
jgi:hypothetical protein